MLEDLALPRVHHAPDTRFDRVGLVAESEDSQSLPQALRGFCMAAPLLVAGSTWPADEKHLIPFLVDQVLPAGWRVLLAPHRVDEEGMAALCQQLPNNAFRWSQNNGAPLPEDCRILVMDQIGLLGALYGLGQAAYVGGAFGTGLHNVLEPAAFGLPLAFGPHHARFPEAKALIDAGAAQCVTDQPSLATWFALLRDNKAPDGLSAEGHTMGKAAAAFVAANRGGTAQITAQILADEAARQTP